jgi:paraquat-inducible protein B
LEVSVDASGVNIKTESMQSILTGGIAFETPATAMSAEPSAAGTTFRLFDSQASLAEAQYTIKRPYLLYFDGSVRGLVPGSPVEFRGIKIGSVTDVHLQFDAQMIDARIPVTIELEPQRIEVVGVPASDRSYDLMARLVERGLRAKLQPGNLLTGQLTVALDVFPDSPPAKLVFGGKYPEVPTIPSDIEEITRSLTGLLDKLSALPIDQLADEARSTIQNVNQLIRSPSVQRAVQSLEGIGPILDAARRATEEAAKTLERANATVGSAQDVIGPDSSVRRDLVEALRELRDSARALRLFADYLERHPDAVIRGKSGEGR